MSEEIKKVTGSISIEVNVECPHCEAYIDLMEIECMKGDGFIYARVFGDRFGCKDFGKEIDCPDCGKAFEIGEIEY